MRKVFVFLVVAFLIGYSATGSTGEIPTVIFDTDMSSDVDDVGALAVLHALADKGEIRLLATVMSSGDPWGAPCLFALNAWFGRPDLPVGTVRGRSVVHESKYTRALAEEFGPKQAVPGQVADAVALYRKVLANAPDRSVTIITVGYLTNLANLLRSGPDEHSPLAGAQLVEEKVKQLVTMGGQFPKGREWNLYQDTEATLLVMKTWPTGITFCGFELGNDILTGAGLSALAKAHPVRRGYELYNGLTHRQSWDQVTVLYAVRGQEKGMSAAWFQKTCGRIVVLEDGANTWQAGQDCSMAYVSRRISAQVLAAQVEALMSAR